jgi:hypothetical protein
MIDSLPPAPVRKTDAEGNWINREQFKRESYDWLYSISGIPALVKQLAACEKQD